MSFGFSKGDLVAVGTLATNLYDALQNAAPEFQDCASLCHEVSLVIEGYRPKNLNSVLRVQDSKTVAELAGSCKTTLSHWRACSGRTTAWDQHRIEFGILWNLLMRKGGVRTSESGSVNTF